MHTIKLKPLPALLALAFSGIASAAPVADDFTGAASSLNWQALDYACLTNGNGSGTIPACNPLQAAGNGALRLTPASNSQTGAILSNFTFPSNQGLQVTFTTYTYGGDSGGTAQIGADGLSFFLTDGTKPLPTTTGGSGGALGYSCSNTNTKTDGLANAYLGLGVDEYGNFLNSGDNTSTGVLNTNSTLPGVSVTNGGNTFSNSPNNPPGDGTGQFYQPNRIGLRGAGNVNWAGLNAQYPLYYPSTLTTSNQRTAVQKTCKTGTLWNYGVTLSSAITAVSGSGKILTVTVPNHSFSNNSTVTIGGTITDAIPTAKAITGFTTNNTPTLTVTVPNHGFANGDSVNLGGTITDASPARSISTVSTSGTTRTFTTSSSHGFTSGDEVKLTGVTSSNLGTLTGSYTITVTSATQFKITFSANPGTISGSSKQAIDTSPAIPGQYTITNVTQNTFSVTLSGVPWTITNTSGTAALANVPTIPGTYTINNVTANTFDIAFGSTLGTLTNTSGTIAATPPVQLPTTVQDYAAIPGGYWVLPNTQLIANEAAQVRASAFPVTYKLLLTQTGLLSFQYSYNGGAFQPVLTNQSISAANGPMPSTFRFGFTAATGGSNNVHEISCFLAQPTQSASSAGANTIQSGQVRTGTQIYLATYNPNNWFGSVVSDPLVVSNGVPSVSSNATWDANCNLTGGGCASMGTDVNGNPLNTVTVQSPSSRQLLTWSGTSGVALQWGSLAGSQQTVLNASDSLGQKRLDWLRGGRGNEQSAGGALRQRTGVLGDVINSSPSWVGNPSMGYPTVFTDKLYGASGAPENAVGAPSYNTYATNNVSRTNVVYSGSNDGMLHGFRTGSNNADGSYNSTNNDGVEVLGFMPSSVLANANVVSLTSPLYAHQYFVDATPGSGDLFYNNSWHTWLVGGLGTGGAEIYALDITDPSQFSESNAASLVKGDWTAATLTNLGNTVGTPIIRRLHNGQWAIIFGNGFGSSAGHAGVYVGLVNASTGAVSYTWLDTGAGSSSNPDGIGYVTAADIDSDNVTDYLYAGDILGNVWRFDLTSSNTADWAVSKFGNATPTPLFVAQDGGGIPQSITTEVAIATSNTGGAKRVLAMVGTGQKFPLTASSAETYASGTQTVYGIWDWDMTAWNTGTTTANGVTIPASAATYAALSAPQTVTRTDLLTQTLSSQVAAASGSQVLGYRAISSTNNVCWKGSAASCAQYGWLFDLPDTNEQIVYSPIVESGSLIVNTTIPPSSSVNQCNPTLPSGWTMAFNIASGGGQSQNFFPDSSGSLTPSSPGFSVNGIRLDGTGSSRVVTVGSTPYIVTQTVNGNPAVSRINPSSLSAPTVTRMTWEEIL